MLSILIPVYNDALNELLAVLSKMTGDLQIPFEICIADDASTASEIQKANQLLAAQHNCRYTRFSENRGRTATRQFLAAQAHYDHLLFLDADVLPLRKNFLTSCVEHLDQAQVVFGGIAYPKTVPPKENALHYTYGKKREVKSVSERNQKAYLALISQHLLIEKSVFLKCNPAEEKAYGLDPYFSHRLEQQQVSVLHIDNPTVHHGIETSAAYLLKTHQALETLVHLEKQQLIPLDYRPLQRVRQALEKRKLAPFLLRQFTRYEHRILKNLCGSNPNLRLFDLYRLCYYLKLKREDETR